jgi:hypothetical protein
MLFLDGCNKHLLLLLLLYPKRGQKTNYYEIRARDEVEGFYLIIIGLLIE